MNRSIQLEINNVSQSVTSNIFELEVPAFNYYIRKYSRLVIFNVHVKFKNERQLDFESFCYSILVPPFAK